MRARTDGTRRGNLRVDGAAVSVITERVHARGRRRVVVRNGAPRRLGAHEYRGPFPIPALGRVIGGDSVNMDGQRSPEFVASVASEALGPRRTG